MFARTCPVTIWEIKSFRDIEDVRTKDAIKRDVQGRLRKLKQPYILGVDEYPEHLADVPRTIRALERELRRHFHRNGELPRMFCVEGLHVEATAVAPNESGFFSGMLGHEHTFTNEYIKHPAKRIRDAADQLSPEIAGVVVIDSTEATWFDEEYVVDACFGEDTLAVQSGRTFTVR